MEESTWLTSDNPAEMLRFVTENPDHADITCCRSDRKLRLWACGCCRLAWGGAECGRCKGKKRILDRERMARDKRTGRKPMFAPSRACETCRGTGRVGGLTDPRSRAAVETSERFADGLATEEEWDAFRTARGVVFDANTLMAVTEHDAAEAALHTAEDAARFFGQSPAAQAGLLRCIIGSPFRPVPRPTKCADGPACSMHGYPWLTPTVLSLAQAAYTDRRPDGLLDPEALGVLADAVEEAGLSNLGPCPTCGPYHADTANPFGTGPGYHPERDVASGRHEGGWTNCKTCNGGGRGRCGVVPGANHLLAHLRSPGPHGRGCHCVDLILGKE